MGKRENPKKLTYNQFFVRYVIIGVLVTLVVGTMIGSYLKNSKEEVEPPEPSEPMVELTDLAPYIIYTEVSLTPMARPLVEVSTIEEALKMVAECEVRKDAAHTMAETARTLGYGEDHPIIQLAAQEWQEAEAQCIIYQEKHDRFEQDKWYYRTQEYPEATYIWLYLKDLGYNDYVCAGIMGNIMTEVGGQALKIDPSLYSSGKYFYGICQWNKKNYSKIHGADLPTQCDYLRDSIEYEFKVYGYAYAKGFGYESFLNMTDARAAALAFARVYERCGEESHRIRQDNAEKALSYFTK